MERLKSEDRLRILETAVESKNIIETCRLFGVSRASFYGWLRRYERAGLEGLADRPRGIPRMPNRVSAEAEGAILDYARLFPDDGPRRISYELSRRGVKVGETGVYRVLLRRGLSKRGERRAAAARDVVSPSAISTPAPVPLSPPPEEPGGSVLAMATLFLKGQGYLFSAVDCRSGFVLARLFPGRRAENAVKLLESRVFPLFRSLGLSLEGIATSPASEYQSPDPRSRHLFSSFLASRGLRQYAYRDKGELPGSGFEDFYEALRDGWLAAAQPRPELGEFIHRYNCVRRGADGSSAFERLRRSRDANEPLPLWCFLGEGLS